MAECMKVMNIGTEPDEKKISFNVHMNGKNTETILVAGRSVDDRDLMETAWRIPSVVYVTMKAQKNELWDSYADFFRREMTAAMDRDEFWEGRQDALGLFSHSSDHYMNIEADTHDEHVRMKMKAENGLSKADYLYAICSVMKKSQETMTPGIADWFQFSLQEMMHLDSYWTRDGVSPEEISRIRMNYMASSSSVQMQA